MKRNFKFRVFYKYILPLLLFAIVIEILIIAPARIDKSQNLSTESEIPIAQSNTAEQLMKGVHLVETHENGKDWELWAEAATSLREDGTWILENVKVRFFGYEGVYYDVSGTKGVIEPQNKRLVVEGDVTTVSSNGYTMKMNGAYYDAETKKLNSDSAVRMLGPAIKKESRLELTGIGMSIDLNSKDFNILKDIKAKKVLREGQLLTLTSNTAGFNALNFKASFLGNLVADYGAFRITGDTAELEVDSISQKVKQISVAGNVRLSDINRFAVAERATMYPIERKLVLSGSPRLIQNNNELNGEEIVFFDGSNRIQVKKAKAKFDKIIKGFQ